MDLDYEIFKLEQKNEKLTNMVVKLFQAGDHMKDDIIADDPLSGSVASWNKVAQEAKELIESK